MHAPAPIVPAQCHMHRNIEHPKGFHALRRAPDDGKATSRNQALDQVGA